jgi:hypothetical protein
MPAVGRGEAAVDVHVIVRVGEDVAVAGDVGIALAFCALAEYTDERRGPKADARVIRMSASASSSRISSLASRGVALFWALGAKGKLRMDSMAFSRIKLR